MQRNIFPWLPDYALAGLEFAKSIFYEDLNAQEITRKSSFFRCICASELQGTVDLTEKSLVSGFGLDSLIQLSQN